MELGKSFGILAKILLNSDSAFLALFILAQTDGEETYKYSRCPVCLSKVCTIADDRFRIVAALTICMAYAKIYDDSVDEPGFRSVLFERVLRNLHEAAESIVQEYGVEHFKMKALMDKQHRLLQEKRGPDDTMVPFQEGMGSLFENLTKLLGDSERSNWAKQVGGEIAKVIYLLDCMNDWFKDVKCNRYNPLAVLKREDSRVAWTDEETHSIVKLGQPAIEHIQELISLGRMPRYQRIIENIFFVALPNIFQNAILNIQGSNPDVSEAVLSRFSIFR